MANLHLLGQPDTPFSLKGLYILYDQMPWPTDEEFAPQGATDRGFRGFT